MRLGEYEDAFGDRDRRELFRALEELIAGQRRVESMLERLGKDPAGGHGAADAPPGSAGCAVDLHAGPAAAPEAPWRTTTSVYSASLSQRSSRGLTGRSSRKLTPARSAVQTNGAFQRAAAATPTQRMDCGEVEAPSWFVLRPDSAALVSWDLLGSCVVLYDSIMIPYLLAWGRSSERPFEVVIIITFCFWLLDMILGFFSGFHQAGQVMLGWRSVMKHYLHGMFVPNMILVLIEAVSILISSMHSAHRSVLLISRLLRYVQLFRSERLQKICSHVNRFTQHLHLKRHSVVGVKLSGLVSLIMWISHLFACCWKAVGSTGQAAYYASHGFEEWSDNLWLDYISSYYWATNTIIAGESITIPGNSAELLVTISCSLFGLVWCSIAIGVIGDTLFEFRLAARHDQQQVETLRKYMSQSRIPFVFASLVEREATRKNQSTRVLEENVKLLKNLSPTVADDLRALVFGPAVSCQVFLRACSALSSQCVGDVCSLALGHRVLVPGELAFQQGEMAEGAVLAFWGNFEYVRPVLVPSAAPARGDADGSRIAGADGASSPPGSCAAAPAVYRQERVPLCRWLCEAALFCSFEHEGSMRATCQSELLTISGSSLYELSLDDPAITDLFMAYADEVRKALNDRVSDNLDFDMPIAHIYIVRLLPAAVRVSVSQAGFDMISRSKAGMDFFGGFYRRALAEDVLAGKSDLIVRNSLESWKGPVKENVVRAVPMVALRLENEHGQVLVHIGTLSRKEGAKCLGLKLPCAEVELGMRPSDAVELVLEHVGWIKDLVFLEGVAVQEEEVNASEPVNIQTVHILHVAKASVDSDWDEKCEFTDLPIEPSSPSASPQRGRRNSIRMSRVFSLDSKPQVRRTPSHEAEAPSLLKAFVTSTPGPRDEVPAFAWIAPEDVGLVGTEAQVLRMLSEAQLLTRRDQPPDRPEAEAKTEAEAGAGAPKAPPESLGLPPARSSWQGEPGFGL